MKTTGSEAEVHSATVPLRASGLWRKTETLAGQADPRPGLSADERPVVPTGTVFGDRYTVQEHVGTGAFATVYRATDLQVPGHTVAVKLLHRPSTTERAKERVLRELHHIASVFHPSLVQYKDHGWYHERLWFVMPWYQGETLEQRIRRKPLSRSEARRIFEPLACAVAAMHAAGIRHQDIKPDNIFLARLRGYETDDALLFGEQVTTAQSRRKGAAHVGVVPILLDLGVATRETERALAGTPSYFAPEIAARFAELDEPPPVTPQSDVYSLALSLRNALEPDTAARCSHAEMRSFVHERATRQVGGPHRSDLQYLVPSFERWLSRDPDCRPNARQFAEEISILTAPEEKREKRLTILRWVIPILLTLGSLLLGTLAVLYHQRQARIIEAEQARLAEAGLRANNRELSADVDALRFAYNSVVADNLRLGRQLERTRARARTLRAQLDESDVAMALAEQELEEVSHLRDRTRKRNRALEQRLIEIEEEAAALLNQKHESDKKLKALRKQLDVDESSARTQELRETPDEPESGLRYGSTAQGAVSGAKAGGTAVAEDVEPD